MRTRLRWTIGIVLGLFLFGYLIGGTEGYAQFARNIRARLRTVLEPPTPQQMQRAVTRDSADNQAMTKAVERARKAMPLGQPAPRAVVLTLVGGIFVASVGMMFLTGRDKA